MQRNGFQVVLQAGGQGAAVIVKTSQFPAVGAVDHVDGLAVYLLWANIGQLVRAQYGEPFVGQGA